MAYLPAVLTLCYYRQVSLGDFACAKKASKGIMAGAVRCVAAWAVEACPVVECLWREEKQSGTHVRALMHIKSYPHKVHVTVCVKMTH